jgi:hypothetical protein
VRGERCPILDTRGDVCDHGDGVGSNISYCAHGCKSASTLVDYSTTGSRASVHRVMLVLGVLVLVLANI